MKKDIRLGTITINTKFNEIDDSFKFSKKEDSYDVKNGNMSINFSTDNIDILKDFEDEYNWIISKDN